MCDGVTIATPGTSFVYSFRGRQPTNQRRRFSPLVIVSRMTANKTRAPPAECSAGEDATNIALRTMTTIKALIVTITAASTATSASSNTGVIADGGADGGHVAATSVTTSSNTNVINTCTTATHAARPSPASLI